MTDVRIGLIGCGRWGRNLARVLAAQGALAAIAVRNPGPVREFAASLGAPLLEPDALLADAGVDAVAIATPPTEHPRLATAALAAGKHVYVEKPLALTPQGARACAEAAEAAGRVLMVGHIMLHNPAFTRLAEMVRAGAVGRVRRVTSRRLLTAPGAPGESALWMLAPHDVSMTLRLLGPPQAVGAQRSGDDWRLRLDHPGGAVAEIRVARPAARKQAELVVEGEAGAIVFDDAAEPGRRLVLHAGDRLREGIGRPVAFAQVEPLAAEMACFVDAVRGRGAPVSDAAEALAVVEILSRAERAGAQKQIAPG